MTMKTLRSFCVILGFSFLGEALHALLPFPIPASIYGLLALFLALLTGLVKLEQIKETGSFLAGILSLLFVSPVVNLWTAGSGWPRRCCPSWGSFWPPR